MSRPRRQSKPAGTLRSYGIAAALGMVAAGSIALAGAGRSSNDKPVPAAATTMRGSILTAEAEHRPAATLPSFVRLSPGRMVRGDAVPDGERGDVPPTMGMPPVSAVPPSFWAAANTTVLPNGELEALRRAVSVSAASIPALPIVQPLTARTGVATSALDTALQQPFQVPGRLLRSKVVAPHTNPDFDLKVNERTTLGMFGDVSPAAKVDPRNINLRKDVGAGLTLQYKFPAN